MPYRRKDEEGVSPGIIFFGVLIIFIIVFTGTLYYLAGPPRSYTNTAPPHTYFEDQTFALPTGQTWHVGVPISQDGKLLLSISANSSVQVYVKEGNSYLLNSVVWSSKNFTLPVTSSMGIIEVGVTNASIGPALVEQFSCVWTT